MIKQEEEDMKILALSSVKWLCFLAVIAVGIPVRGQTPEGPSGQPLPTTGTTESRIGPLAFEGGYPTDAAVTRLYDEMDFQRATQCYLWAIPIVSFAKCQEQYEKVFGQEDGDLVLTLSVREKRGISRRTTPRRSYTAHHSRVAMHNSVP